MEVTSQDQVSLDRQPKSSDPLEIAIRAKLEHQLLSTDWARASFVKMRQAQIEFYRKALSIPPDSIRKDYLQLVATLADIEKANIVEGEENLNQVDPSKPLIVITNHLGTAKISSFQPGDIGIDVAVDTIEPFPIRHSAITRVAEKQNRPILETAVRLPPPLDSIQSASGVITIAAAGIGRLRELENNTKRSLTELPNALVVMYPEGGTSGKWNSGGPYNLDQFQTGAFVVAEHLNIPVLPVCQYFNPSSGMELAILPKIEVASQGNKEYFIKLANETQQKIQQWLNSRK